MRKALDEIIAGKSADVVLPARLFNRFYSSDHARTNNTGLGLSIVKLLAEQMDGSAYASLQGGFIEISIELPLHHPKVN
ncbi:ATP-binding protein [Paenibacillus sp. L3-i20]|uniref:ATP-binding protein n=1 Tax=Paenibacillus sp. L3-i20 TaxID=2905833 RepID=UPI001EDD9185|nr:ATP-binding protein [Paenibacillus sp. L3-i20]GKU77391.1 hypothetical protein L3i20_v217880 [Paenibacillus sp. L3-i20]